VYLAAGKADHQVASAPAERAEGRVGRDATDRIEHDLHAVGTPQRLRFVFPRAAGVEYGIGASRFGSSTLDRTGGAGDHPRAQHFSELHCGCIAKTAALRAGWTW